MLVGYISRSAALEKGSDRGPQIKGIEPFEEQTTCDCSELNTGRAMDTAGLVQPWDLSAFQLQRPLSTDMFFLGITEPYLKRRQSPIQ